MEKLEPKDKDKTVWEEYAQSNTYNVDETSTKRNVVQQFVRKYKPKYIQIEYNWHHLVKNVNLYYFSTILKNYNVFKIFPNDKKLIKIDPLKPEHNYFNFSNIVFIRK